MTTDAILARLMTLHPRVIDLELTRIQRLLDALGNPERKLPPVVHVAGTNGKGSLVAYTRAMAEAAGLRVHAYISPHLVRFNERIRLAGSLIDDLELEAILEECELANDGQPITYFEITTAAAFAIAARKATVEPLPLVPATCTTGDSFSFGWPSAARSRSTRPSERSMIFGCSRLSRSRTASLAAGVALEFA